MKNFGIIIRHYRTQANISMASLAEGICTKHYIYLIENGKRTPSIKIIDELSAKLNFDWRDYVDYAASSCPIESKQLIDKFEHYNKTFDIDKLNDLLNNLPNEQWLQCYPINIEVWIQKLSIYIFFSEEKIKDYKQVKNEFLDYITPLASKKDFVYMPAVCLKSLNIYASLLIKNKEYNEALSIYKRLLRALEKKRNIVRYYCVYIDVYHSLIHFYQAKKDHKKMLLYGIKLMKYQEEKSLIDKIPLTLILIGDSYKYLQNRTLAFKYYKRAISISKIIKNTNYTSIAEKHISNLYI